MADNEKSPVEQAIDQALDLFVYAPLGLAMTAREQLPSLVEKGRTQVTTQTTMARMMGQFAVQMGEKELRRRLEQLGERFTPPPAGSPRAAAPAADGPTTSSATSSPAAQANGKAHGHEKRASSAPPAPSAPAQPQPTSDHLAIPGYDSLSASQVVQRLAGLSGDELDAVRDYESSTRGRRTILTKVAQLQTDSS